MQARSRLYGRRLRGDVGPINFDPATGLPGRIMGPCVSLDGYDQQYEEVSDDQHFTLGSRMQVDSRVFYYARAGNTLDPDFGAHIGFTQDVAWANLAEDAAIGDYTIVLVIAATDGRLGTGEIGEDELSGGNIIIFTGVGNSMNRRIVRNTAVAAPGGNMTVTLDRPIVVDLTAANAAEMIASPYLDVLEGNYDRWMIVGMPAVLATVGQYLWLQTWGPVWITPNGIAGVGVDNSQVMFRGNGSMAEFDGAPAPPVGQCQIAGTIMTTARLGGQGAPFVNLMISP